MERITGVVEAVNEKVSPPGSPRKWVQKGFKINGEWFSTFITKENIAEVSRVKEGDAVKVAFEVKGNFKNLTNIEVTESEESTVVATGVPTRVSSTSGAYNVADKEYRITYLASRRDAIEFAKTLVQLELVSLGNKKDLKVDIFYALVKEYATKFAEDAYASRAENTADVVVAVADEGNAIE